MLFPSDMLRFQQCPLALSILAPLLKIGQEREVADRFRCFCETDTYIRVSVVRDESYQILTEGTTPGQYLWWC